MVLTILNGCAERVQTLLGSGTAQLSCYSACILLHFLAACRLRADLDLIGLTGLDRLTSCFLHPCRAQMLRDLIICMISRGWIDLHKTSSFHNSSGLICSFFKFLITFFA